MIDPESFFDDISMAASAGNLSCAEKSSVSSTITSHPASITRALLRLIRMLRALVRADFLHIDEKYLTSVKEPRLEISYSKMASEASR
jgi:hypothetical protein